MFFLYSGYIKNVANSFCIKCQTLSIIRNFNKTLQICRNYSSIYSRTYHVGNQKVLKNQHLRTISRELKQDLYRRQCSGLLYVRPKYGNFRYKQLFGHRVRWYQQEIYEQSKMSRKHVSVLLYLLSAAVLVTGFSYAAVPLYRIYCQATGYGGTTKKDDISEGKIENLARIAEREIKIRFEAGTNKKLQWKFRPQQKEVKVSPGETALAFYTAENLTDRPIIGIATYNVIPFDAGQYFNKIQCFCFEEQQLNPHEEVDMPVFFYIDPEFDEDPKMAKVDEIILSYTFFESKDAEGIVVMPH